MYDGSVIEISVRECAHMKNNRMIEISVREFEKEEEWNGQSEFFFLPYGYGV